METSNRVIRYFCDKTEHFLRVQFVDEALSKVGSSNRDTSNHALYDRVYCTLRDGRHYEFLTFSASQLRDHSIIVVVFSSARAIQKLPIDDIIEIPDIIRNGFTLYLNRQAIILLSALGIPDEVFIELKDLRVRFPKTGTPPEFPPVLRAKNFDQRLYVDGYEEFLDDARKLRREYNADIRGLMNQFGIMTGIEVTNGYIMNTITKVDKKTSQCNNIWDGRWSL
ncbi:hypothetical protein C1646_772921 [Rhizophagus diaphanus]|nr:hypothetical protein C1646_772921 [Rhizophagus diaphanus] [Rhizophagus sp. MUCL 43196]